VVFTRLQICWGTRFSSDQTTKSANKSSFMAAVSDQKVRGTRNEPPPAQTDGWGERGIPGDDGAGFKSGGTQLQTTKNEKFKKDPKMVPVLDYAHQKVLTTK
jgi:hypothetical protein